MRQVIKTKQSSISAAASAVFSSENHSEVIGPSLTPRLVKLDKIILLAPEQYNQANLPWQERHTETKIDWSWDWIPDKSRTLQTNNNEQEQERERAKEDSDQSETKSNS